MENQFLIKTFQQLHFNDLCLINDILHSTIRNMLKNKIANLNVNNIPRKWNYQKKM